MIYNIKHYHPSGRVLVCMYKSFTITFLRSLPRFICSQYPSAILPVVGHTLPGRLGSLPRFICSQYPSAILPVVGRTLPGRSSIAWWGATLVVPCLLEPDIIKPYQAKVLRLKFLKLKSGPHNTLLYSNISWHMCILIMWSLYDVCKLNYGFGSSYLAGFQIPTYPHIKENEVKTYTSTGVLLVRKHTYIY